MRQRASEQLQFECVCSFLEVYNESIYDLLQPTHVSLPVSPSAAQSLYCTANYRAMQLPQRVQLSDAASESVSYPIRQWHCLVGMHVSRQPCHPVGTLLLHELFISTVRWSAH